MPLTRSEIASILRSKRKKSPTVKTHRRPTIRKRRRTLDALVTKGLNVRSVRMEEVFKWGDNPLLKHVVPQRGKGVDSEYIIVRWVERGIHPYTKVCYGPAPCRSTFDYLSDHQVDLAIRLSNEYMLKSKNTN